MDASSPRSPPSQPRSVRRVPPKPGSGKALERCLVTGGRAVSGGSSVALSQGDERHRPISYAGLGPWV